MKLELHRPTTALDRNTLRELALVFLRLGATAFGGPAAHIAMMEDELVRRRKWLTREEFLDLIGAASLIPGPNSTEVAIHIGYLRGGWIGLLAAGSAFIIPAAMSVTAIAWAYVRFGHLPATVGILYGIKPVMIVVVLQALKNLGKAAIKTKPLAALGVVAVILTAFGANELVVLFGAGALMGSLAWATQERPRPIKSLVTLSAVSAGFLVIPFLLTYWHSAGRAAFGIVPLFLFFAKVGSVLFGSGYVLLAFLRDDLVTRLHWLTSSQLLDAIAVGQVTPGPVFTTATFIGYLLGGPVGALAATVGIFLPAFIFVAASGPILPRVRKSPVARAFLDGVNAASLALMAVVAWQLARAAVLDDVTVGIAIIAAILLFRWRINTFWLVLGGAAAGLLAHYGQGAI